MAGTKQKSVYRCAECGAEHPKWGGRCDACDAWNTLVEEIVSRKGAGLAASGGTASKGAEPVRLENLASAETPRFSTRISELDFVLGGGIVPGSLTLVGGEPGVGKSTLLLQCATKLESAGVATLYASGEESTSQIKLRADRLEGGADDVLVLPEVRLESVIATAASSGIRVLVVDSIQTMYTDDLDGAPGNVGQVRECASKLMRFAKESGCAVVLVGHVTRGGGIAGPKTLEHIVDTVIYFEGELNSGFRILRAVKNRFGAVDEVGVFEMTAAGLKGVTNPSAAFISSRDETAPGTAITALMEGSRPVLVEVQALASKSGFGTPQRVATGLEQKKLAVLLAVLQRRAGIPFSDLDVFINVTGGVRLIETASDLAVVAALWSSVSNRPVPANSVFLGEVGLGGEIRPVGATERRLAEARRLGFDRAYVPARGNSTHASNVRAISHISELADAVAS
jgi:DNA repair protein RadA/Sms